MPPRYQQNQLASQVVGTPGLDRSAGQASFAAARAIDEMTTTANQLAIQNGRQAQQSLESAGNALMYYGEKQAAEQRRQAAIAKAEADEQRKLQVQFDLLDENDRMDKVIGDLKTKYAANPEGALEAFNQQIPQMREDFQGRYGADEKRLRMLMPAQRHSENAAQTHLAAWAKETINANLNARLAALPEELGQKIDNLEGSVPEQLLEFQRQLIPVNQVYQNMQDSAVSEADRIEIQTKRMNMGNAKGRQFIDHLFAQVPPGEDGVKYLESMRSIVERPQKFGVPLASKDHKEVVNDYQSRLKEKESDAVNVIKTEADLQIMDASKLKADLIDASSNPAAMREIVSSVKKRIADIDSQVDLISKDPDSNIKRAKITGLKSLQSKLIGELGDELRFQRQHTQDMRAAITFAQGQTRFAQGQIIYSQNQLMYQQRQFDRDERIATKKATEEIAKKTDAFNSKWAVTQKELYGAWAMPDGAARQQKVTEIIKGAVPILDDALAAGNISTSDYKARIDQLNKQGMDASMFKTQKTWFGFGPEETKKITNKKELQKAQAEAQRATMEIVSQNSSNFRHLESALSQVKTMSTSKLERAVLTNYVNTHLPKLLSSNGFRKLSPTQQQSEIAKAIKKTVEQNRLGILK